MPDNNLLRKELREQRWVFVFGTLILAVTGIFCAWSFTFIPQYSGLIAEFLGPLMAEELQNMQTDYNYFLWSQWQPKNLLQLGTVLALILAAPAVAGEVNRGTFEFLTSRPVSRTGILLTKALAGALTLSAVLWAATLLTLATGYLFEPGLLWGKQLAATALVNVGLLGIYSVGLVFSTFASDGIKAGALAGGVLLAWSAFGLFDATRFLSPFWHAKGIAWFLGAELFPWPSLAALGILATAGLLAAVHLFRNKEY